MKRERLLTIQFARGIAALLVMVYHASRMVALPQYAGHIGFGGAFQFGHAGVDFFFVLSGFIIYFVHHGDLGRPQRFARYAWRRVTRIYPSYWLVAAFALALIVAKHDGSLTPHRFVTSMLLLPDTREPFLSVAWTLVFEMLFYSVFALGILNLRLGVLAGVLWLGFAASDWGDASQSAFLQLAGAFRCAQFAIGIVAAAIVLRGGVPWPRLVLCAGIAAFLGLGMAENAGLVIWNSAPVDISYALCAGTMIAGMATAEQRGALKVGRIGEFFGGTSYLLYLVHLLSVGLTFRLLARAGLFPALPGWSAVLLAMAVSAGVAAFLYRVFEQPVQAALGRVGRRYVFA